jgi:sulfoxide reductase heme-binding subunit YedZ
MPTTGTISAVTGVLAMVLLSAVLVLGILLDRRVRLPGLPRFAGLSLHRYASLLSVAFLAVHILTAVLEPYARVGLAAIVIPLVSSYARPWLALGTVATDLMIAIIGTSLLRRHLSHRTWRAVHWTAYACWPAALAHSLTTGPAMRSGRLEWLAAACAAAVVGAAAWRVISAWRAGGALPPPAPSGRSRPALTSPGPRGDSTERLRLDPVLCTGHGLCAELLPELIVLDAWGYPLLSGQPVPLSLAGRARRTATDCPALALRLVAGDPD